MPGTNELAKMSRLFDLDLALCDTSLPNESKETVLIEALKLADELHIKPLWREPIAQEITQERTSKE
jgi:hypothetical protein